MRRRRSARGGLIVAVAAIGAITLAGVGAALLALLLSVFSEGNDCASSPSGSIALGPPGTGRLVGATEYGGPGDPSSGTVGSSGANLIQYSDSYAELGGDSFQTATAMGGLAYMT